LKLLYHVEYLRQNWLKSLFLETREGSCLSIKIELQK
jgi:hypothetical protein